MWSLSYQRPQRLYHLWGPYLKMSPAYADSKAPAQTRAVFAMENAY